MATAEPSTSERHALRIPWLVALCVFLLIAVFFLWQEHRAHLFGALPYLLLLICPLMHLFMHHGHGGHGGARHRHADGGAS
jgi:hypothetical protein